MVRFIINALLFVVAQLLYFFVKPINFTYNLFNGVGLSKCLEESVDTLNKNACLKYSRLWKKILITNDGIGFDSATYFMSYWLGANKQNGTLTKLGVIICNILDRFDKGHVDRIYDKYKDL